VTGFARESFVVYGFWIRRQQSTSFFEGSMNTLRDLFFLNLTLQIFDGLFSYQVFSLGAEEANPIVAAAISN